MKTLLGISVLFCFIQLTYAQTNCTGSPDRLITYGCRAFTACKNETYVNVECPPGQVVDTERILCDDPENVPPPCGGNRNCTEREDGGYPDYFTNCTSFYICLNGVNRGTGFCPGDLVYDDDRDLCDRPDNVCEPCGNKPAGSCAPTVPFTGSTVTTEEVSTIPPIYRNCTGKPDGYYPDLENSCAAYFTCAGQVISGFYECPGGLVFDPEDEICDWNYDTCPPCGSGAAKEPGYCKNCTAIPDGLYPDLDDSCSGAYRCQFDTMKYRGFCPSGSVYDPERFSCNNNTEDVCPPCYTGAGTPPERCPTEAPTEVPIDSNSTNPDRNCTGRPDGYYPDLTLGCRWFFTCENELTTGQYECASDLVFDPEDQTCDRVESTCGPCGTGSAQAPGYCKNCTGVPNGLYADLEDSCSGSYTCQFELMRSRTVCPSGSVYDPERQACTEDTEDVCPPCYNGSGSPPARCPTEAPSGVDNLKHREIDFV
ncbi:unnamed protein product [Owenia fusiformis]|uniref:Uncharacterized protein n=1 Tax=Owenia fusiformis TaxID=6347 RepID=A0A8J1TLM3_OWEFU|nr:unnamed protein product [Owenia fusiformis]